MSLEEIRTYINDIRRKSADRALDEDSVTGDPFEQFSVWFDEAVGAQVPDPFAMAIATVSEIGYPSVRMVYMRDINEDGIIFYTNFRSQKGKDILGNRAVSILFHWDELERQIRIAGRAEKVSDKVSDAYFASRPRESQLGAWSSEQSERLENRAVLEGKYQYYKEKFNDLPVPRPEHWGGFLIRPIRFEFWQGRPNRLHDRVVYTRENLESNWEISRVAP